MKLLSEIEFPQNPTCATIGFFDGVHSGHRYILSELKKISAQENLESLIVSFKNHPKNFFSKNENLKLLSPENEKISLLSKTQIDNLLLLNFNEKIAKMKAEDFLIFLKNFYKIKILLVGYDHHFGCDKEKNFNDYLILGEKIGVKIIQCNALINNDLTASSSKIRNFLENAQIENAARLLGYDYSIRGTVIHGNQIGRKIGFPTANLNVDNQKLIPANGVYFVKIKIGENLHKGMLNIGFRPTLTDKIRTIEVHIFNFNENIYGKKIEVIFQKFIRNELKFNSLDELSEQLKKDKILISSL